MKATFILLLLFISVLSWGQVGINTNTPTATLEVVSEGNDETTQALKITNDSGEDLLSLKDNALLGIGTSNPRATLDVNGSIIVGDSELNPVSSGICSKVGEIAYYDDNDANTSNFWGCDGTNWVEL